MTENSGIVVLLLFLSSTAVAQPAAGPLDIQGCDQLTTIGIRSRAMGGTTVANANGASALFSNPAALTLLTSPEIRAGGLWGTTSRNQSQSWVPSAQLPGFSLMFEGLTGPVHLPPDTLSQWQKVQRQYDNITPGWTRKTSAVQPLSFVAAMPFTFTGVHLAAGLGVAQVINLDHYYQNNNSISPYPGEQRPDPYLITAGIDTLHLNWYQYIRKREGTVYGVVPGLSAVLLPGLSAGASATFLTGSSDDNEQRLDRGLINIAIANHAAQNFMLDTVWYGQSKTGTSKYRGTILNFGIRFQQERYSIGLTVTPRMTLTRTWDRTVTSYDSTRKSFPVRIDSLTARSTRESGEDRIGFPTSYSLGIILTPVEHWTIAFDYVVRHLVDATFSSSSGTAGSTPWTNDKGEIHFGVEYLVSDMLALRGGYREDIQAFAPDGSAIIGEPARGGIYSAGIGLAIKNIVVDLEYEYAHLQYQDLYQSNFNDNSRSRNQVLLEIGYRP